MNIVGKSLDEIELEWRQSVNCIFLSMLKDNGRTPYDKWCMMIIL